MELGRKDKELCERWKVLEQVWEQHRLNGLPVSPLTSVAAPNGELRRSYSVLTPNTVSGQQNAGNFQRPASFVPGHLQGSLVHGTPREEPKTVLPTKLIKDESLSSRFNPLGRSSGKKKWHSTSKLTKFNEDATSPTQTQAQQQIIPNKLASSLNSKKK